MTTASDGPLALKFAIEHTSGHVGDEWQENTGRERIGYTRHEIAVGAARRVRRMRVYGELGYAFHILNDELQRPWRVQTGLERAWPQSWADKRLGWYAATDLQLFEERGWRVDHALEGCVLACSGGRRYRVGARWVDRSRAFDFGLRSRLAAAPRLSARVRPSDSHRPATVETKYRPAVVMASFPRAPRAPIEARPWRLSPQVQSSQHDAT